MKEITENHLFRNLRKDAERKETLDLGQGRTLAVRIWPHPFRAGLVVRPQNGLTISIVWGSSRLGDQPRRNPASAPPKRPLIAGMPGSVEAMILDKKGEVVGGFPGDNNHNLTGEDLSHTDVAKILWWVAGQ